MIATREAAAEAQHASRTAKIAFDDAGPAYRKSQDDLAKLLLEGAEA